MDSIRALVPWIAFAGLGSAAGAQDCLLREGKLIVHSSVAQSRFGRACAVYRDTLAASDINGHVSIFTRSSGLWTEQQTFAASAAGSGRVLALGLDILAVGAPGRFAPPGGFEAGAVDIYVRQAGTWILQTTLTAPPGDVDAYDAFGTSLSLRWDRILIGAPGDDAGGTDAGAAYSFVRTGGSWNFEAKLLDSGAAPGQLLGEVDFDGTRCILGGAAGTTCIFALQGSTWTQEAELAFGAGRVGIDGSVAALWEVGACNSLVHSFERSGSTWTQGPDVLMHWGGDLELRGGRVVVGRPGNPFCFPYARPPRIYSLQGASWQVDAVTGPEVTSSTQLGSSLAFDGATLVVGDPDDDQDGTDAGAVWVFAVGPAPDCPQNYCTAKLNSQQCTPQAFSSGVSSASASSGFYLGAGHVISQQLGIPLYGTSGRDNLPFLGGTLCIAAPLLRGPAVNSGGNSLALDCSGILFFDMNTFAAGGLGGAPSPLLAVPGSVIDVQWWARDPGFAPPDNAQLGAGQEYTVLP